MIQFSPPKDFKRNLEFRRALLVEAERSSSLRRTLMAASARDPVFWLNVFGWVYEPRTPRVLPFITWPFQDRTLRKLDAAIGNHDVGIEKSRDMGASWLVLAAFTHRWLFKEMQSFLLVSRTEQEVDKSDDSDTLFWKIDFLVKKLPAWMRPKLGNYDRTNLHLRNPITDSLIDGRSTTGNVGRGGRRTGVFLDEFAAFTPEDGYRAENSLQHATDCRIYASTPQGGAGPFYDVMHKKGREIERIRLHWSEHPLKNPGLYKAKDNRLVVVDRDFKFKKDYPFILDGKVRSPWYDKECRRVSIPQQIAQELDIDYLASSYQYFDPSMLDELIVDTTRLPHTTADLEHTMDTFEPKSLIVRRNGPLAIWGFLDNRNKPKRGRYVIGCDISAGTGASPTVLCVADADTGEQSALYVNNHIDPKTAGRYAVALARFFCDHDSSPAHMIWEANGPVGRNFGDAVIETGFRNIYFRKQETSLSASSTDTPGWYSGKDEKAAVLSGLREALVARNFLCRDEDTLREAAEYVHTPTGAIEHNGALNTVDLSDKGTNHGDRVIAAALCCKGMRRDRAIVPPREIDPPLGSLGHRHLAERQRAEREVANAW